MAQAGILWAALSCSIAVGAGCGGSSDNSGLSDSDGVTDSPTAVAQATTKNCDRISGPSALYWDFSTGVLRGDYPIESTLPPASPGGSFLHPRLGMTFFFPAGWAATALIDNLTLSNEPASIIQGNITVLSGVNLLRQDNRALWRYLHTTEIGSDSAQQRLNLEIQRILNGFGIADTPEELCSLSGPGFVGGFGGALSATYMRAGEFTIQVVSTSAAVPLFTRDTTYVTVTSVAPTTEFNQQVLDTWLPIGFQLLSRGSSSLTECSDGIDNDGDGQADLADSDCVDPQDESESA